MIEMHTLQSKYQDIQIRATKAELHIIPLLTDGSYEDRTIIPRDSRAGWYVGNRYFETERGSGPYTMHEFGGDTTYVRHSITSPRACCSQTASSITAARWTLSHPLNTTPGYSGS